MLNVDKYSNNYFIFELPSWKLHLFVLLAIYYENKLRQNINLKKSNYIDHRLATKQ